jgi:hypothetical protein
MVYSENKFTHEIERKQKETIILVLLLYFQLQKLWLKLWTSA